MIVDSSPPSAAAPLLPGNPTTVEIVVADYAHGPHADAVVALLDAYARDPMGGGQPLPEHARRTLVPQLAAFPHALSLLAYVPAAAGQGGEAGSAPRPVGLLNAFMGFSTFKAQPLLNVHDVAVLEAFRGRGIARALMAEAERQARLRGCCKLTLEVLAGNAVAQRAYRSQGYAPYDLGESQGQAQFWQKWLD
ncbi:acetyltransferase (GNAT) family protein [Comamonas sp. BIGb0124]|nr:acetyltransferase (GNAT) family protein [Comamonas sp. BIGb0124]